MYYSDYRNLPADYVVCKIKKEEKILREIIYEQNEIQTYRVAPVELMRRNPGVSFSEPVQDGEIAEPIFLIPACFVFLFHSNVCICRRNYI